MAHQGFAWGLWLLATITSRRVAFSVLNSLEVDARFASHTVPGNNAMTHSSKTLSAMTLLTSLWDDEAGFLIAAELVLISTVLILGMVVGLTSVRDAVTHELEDVASAFGAVNQSYRYQSLDGSHKGGWGGGSRFGQQRDFGSGQWDVACGGY